MSWLLKEEQFSRTNLKQNDARSAGTESAHKGALEMRDTSTTTLVSVAVLVLRISRANSLPCVSSFQERNLRGMQNVEMD